MFEHLLKTESGVLFHLKNWLRTMGFEGSDSQIIDASVTSKLRAAYGRSGWLVEVTSHPGGRYFVFSDNGDVLVDLPGLVGEHKQIYTSEGKKKKWRKEGQLA